MKHLFTLIFLLITSLGITQSRNYIPPSETIKDSSLHNFLIQLQKNVQQKNTVAMYTMLSPDIKNDFGDSYIGIKGFKEKWQFNKSNSKFWYYMDRILAMPGCYTSSFSNDETNYSFPYVFCFQPEKNEDVFEMALITTKDVALKQNPSITSKTLLKLNYNIVSYVSKKGSGAIITKGKNKVNDPEWYLITVQNGKKKIKGWVNYKYIYSPVGYRLILGKENNKWLIQAFIAGD